MKGMAKLCRLVEDDLAAFAGLDRAAVAAQHLEHDRIVAHVEQAGRLACQSDQTGLPAGIDLAHRNSPRRLDLRPSSPGQDLAASDDEARPDVRAALPAQTLAEPREDPGIAGHDPRPQPCQLVEELLRRRGDVQPVALEPGRAQRLGEPRERGAAARTSGRDPHHPVAEPLPELAVRPQPKEVVQPPFARRPVEHERHAAGAGRLDPAEAVGMEPGGQEVERRLAAEVGLGRDRDAVEVGERADLRRRDAVTAKQRAVVRHVGVRMLDQAPQLRLLTMANELLEAKIERLETSRPLAPRRSRR